MSIKNWIEEKQSAWLYRVVTRAEFDPIKSTLFAELAEVAESQARIWEKQIRQRGGALPEFHPNLRARLVARLLRLLGPRAVRPLLVAMKVRGMSVYQGGRLRGGPAMPTSVGEVGSRHNRVEPGLNPDELGSPWGAAVSSFISFASGGSAPLLPCLCGSGPGLITAIAV